MSLRRWGWLLVWVLLVFGPLYAGFRWLVAPRLGIMPGEVAWISLEAILVFVSWLLFDSWYTRWME